MKASLCTLLNVLFLGFFVSSLEANDYVTELAAVEALGQLKAVPAMYDADGNASTIKAEYCNQYFLCHKYWFGRIIV